MAININIPSQFLDYNNLAAFPATGSAKILYVAKDTNKLYRWSGTSYVEVSASQASSWGSITGNLASQVDLQGELDNKVNTESGKGLSTNDYTTTEKNKLAGIASGAEVNVNADWNATSGDAQILNKPTIPSIAGLATTSYVDSQDATKQNVLVSGTNIKTINGSSVLGSGNLTISGGGGAGIHAQKTIVSQQWTNLWITYSTAPTTSVATSNRLYCMPFFPNQTFTCDALAINVTTLSVGGLAKILIFSDVNGVPTTKLYESADLDCSTLGQKTASTSFTFNAGTTYWLGFIANNSLNSFTFMQQSSIYGFSTSGAFTGSTNGFLSTTFNAIPTTLTALTYAAGNIPMVSIKKT
jgi:hypothetical protein